MPRLIRIYILLICSTPAFAQQDSIITASSLQQVVEVLAADSFMGRFTGSQHAIYAAQYIANEFKKAGAMPVAGNDGSYFMPFYEKGIAVNVVAALPGKSKAKEIVLFSAHYDHVGTSSSEMPWRMQERGDPEPGDTIYNGANDNASGVSGLIHLARYYAQFPNRERTLVFIAFSGEELGLLGSAALSKSFDPNVVQAMVNMDMIGRPISSQTTNPYLTGTEYSDLRAIMNERLYQRAPEFGKNFFKIDRFPGDNLFKRSDNYWFAMQGIAAHTILLSSPHDKFYHSLNDEPDELDYELMKAVVKGIAIGCEGIIDGTVTPLRTNINPKGR